MKNKKGEIVMMGWSYGMMGGWFGMFILLIFIAVIVYAVFRLSGDNHTSSGKNYDNSLDILNERFARGEISEEEYKRKKEMIMKR